MHISALQPLLQPAGSFFSRHRVQLRTPSATLLESCINIRACRQRDNTEAVGVSFDDFEGAYANRSR